MDADAQPRPAVITVMGHVDHGKVLGLLLACLIAHLLSYFAATAGTCSCAASCMPNHVRVASYSLLLLCMEVLTCLLWCRHPYWMRCARHQWPLGRLEASHRYLTLPPSLFFHPCLQPFDMTYKMLRYLVASVADEASQQSGHTLCNLLSGAGASVALTTSMVPGT